MATISDRSATSPDFQEAYVEHVSAHAFAPTVERTEEAIAHAGLTIFGKIDHHGAAREAGLAMPSTVVLIYGSPRGGTPIMLAMPRVALDLPLRVLVREDAEGRVLVGYHPIASVLRDAGFVGDVPAGLVAAQTILVEAVRS